MRRDCNPNRGVNSKIFPIFGIKSSILTPFFNSGHPHSPIGLELNNFSIKLAIFWYFCHFWTNFINFLPIFIEFLVANQDKSLLFLDRSLFVDSVRKDNCLGSTNAKESTWDRRFVIWLRSGKCARIEIEHGGPQKHIPEPNYLLSINWILVPVDWFRFDFALPRFQFWNRHGTTWWLANSNPDSSKRIGHGSFWKTSTRNRRIKVYKIGQFFNLYG